MNSAGNLYFVKVNFRKFHRAEILKLNKEVEALFIEDVILNGTTNASTNPDNNNDCNDTNDSVHNM